MKYCPHCGAEIADDVRYCPTCGKETVIPNNAEGDPVFDPQDIADNKMLAMLGYISVGILPMVGCRNSAFAMHHVNQALWIYIAGLRRWAASPSACLKSSASSGPSPAAASICPSSRSCP